MSENQEFDPRDLNQDGKVSFEERVKDAANKTGEALKTAAGAVAEGTGKAVDQVKTYVEMSPEERKCKNEELKEKAADLAGKATAAAKEVIEEVKEEAGKIFKKSES